MLCGQPSTSGRPFQYQPMATRFQYQPMATRSRGLQTRADQRQLNRAPKAHQHHCFRCVKLRAAATSDAGPQAPAKLQLLVSMDTEHNQMTILRVTVCTLLPLAKHVHSS